MKLRKIFCLLLSISMVLTMVGCGDKTTASVSASSEPEVSVSVSDEVIIPEPEAVKEVIDDFYTYANGEWIDAVQLRDSDFCIYRTDSGDDFLYDRAEEIFETASFSDESDPMYKLQEYYKQFKDIDQRENKSINRVLELMGKIRSVKTVKGFNEIMKDSTYFIFNDLCYMRYDIDTAGDMFPRILPRPVFELFYDISDENRQIIEDSITKQMEILGFSHEESLEMAQNSNKVDLAIHDFYNNCSGYIAGYNDTNWEKTGCPLDLPGIMEANGYVWTDVYGNVEIDFFCDEDYPGWLTGVVTDENMKAVTDYIAVYIASKLACTMSADFLDANDFYRCLCGAEPYVSKDPHDYSHPIDMMLYYEEGAWADYYSQQYVTEEMKTQVLDMAKEITGAYVEILKEADWLDIEQRERLSNKVKLLRYQIGAYDEYNHLEDFTIEDNIVDSTISLMKSNIKFGQRCLVEGADCVDTTCNLYNANAFYMGDSNTVLVTAGCFADPDVWKDLCYEQMLGSVGATIAHEIGHCYDCSSVSEDRRGLYDEKWENYAEIYYSQVEKLYDYYNGMDTSLGNKINGGMIMNEAVADQISMQALMRVVANHENADYELFFVSFARSHGCVQRPEAEKLMLEQDSHIPARERVNGLLAQFDEFYDLYDVKEDNGFYVEKENRISLFAPNNQ